MTSPRHAESSALGRYYTRPGSGEKLISVTNVLSVAMAKPALVPWAAKIVAEHALDNLPGIVSRSRTDRDGTLRDLKAEVRVARDKAADLGSRIHALADAHVKGQLLPVQDGDDEAAKYVEQYLRFLADFDIDIDRDVEAAEMTVAHPGLGVAGTMDLLVRLPFDSFIPGEPPGRVEDPARRVLVMVDLKTSATRPSTSVYGEYALQLTGLRDMREAWMPDDTIVPFGSGIGGSAVLNLRRGGYALVPLPFTDAERKAWRSAVEVAKWSHDVGHAISNGDYRPISPNGRTKPKQTRKVA